MIQIYHGNNETRELIGQCNMQKEAFDIIEKHVKANDCFASPYYRFWHKNGKLVIDYGSHSKFYYVNFGGKR